MKKNENTKLNRSWMAAFSVATTAFAAHAGGVDLRQEIRKTRGLSV